MALPTAEIVRERILQGYDKRWYDGLYTQACWVFGQKWSAKAVHLSGSASYEDIPIYADIHAEQISVGQSRRMLNVSFRNLSRVLPKAPVPSSPQVDEVTEEIRRQTWLAGANGNRGMPSKWLKHMQYAFTEGNTLGVGAIKHGLKTNPQSGQQQSDMRHVPVLQVIWDPFESDPRNSKWVAVVSYLPFAEAADREDIGPKKAKDNKREWTASEHARAAEFVRIVEYWDVGYAGKKPAYALFVGEIQDGEVEANVGGFIPVTFCVNFVAPGMKRPIGMAMMQMATTEAINETEFYMRETMKFGTPVDVIDKSAFDPDTVTAYKTGKRNQALEVLEGYAETDVQKLFRRHPGQDVPQGVMAWRAFLERQHNDDANQTEQSRGNALGSRTTAREVQNLQARSQEASALTDQQAVEFLQDTISVNFRVTKEGDRHPVPLDIYGKNILFNDPQVPSSFLSAWFEEFSNIVIDIEATTADDEAIKSQQRQQELLGLQPLLGITVDPMKFTNEWLESMNERDKESWILRQPVSAPPGEGKENE